MFTEKLEKGVPIRAVSRCIAILQAVNKAGSLTLNDLSHAVGLPYPTVFRMVQTLLCEGLIELEPDSKYYRATALVNSLSSGFQDDGKLAAICRPYMRALTKRITWPVTVLTQVGQWMIVRDSTNTETSLTFTNFKPGHTFPILESAAGHAFLAFASDDKRAGILNGIELLEGSSFALTQFKSGDLVKRVRANGYAVYERNPHTPTPGKTSSVSVPIFAGHEIVAVLTLTVFADSILMSEVIRRFLPDQKETANYIMKALRK